MNGNPNLNRMVRQAIYELKQQYGDSVSLYRINSAETNYETGEKTSTTTVYKFRRVVILTATTIRKLYYGINYLSDAKQFTGQGQGWDESMRGFIFEGRDLKGLQPQTEDWIVYRGKRYDIMSIQELEYDSGYLMIGKELRGSFPEEVFENSLSHVIDLQDEVESE